MWVENVADLHSKQENFSEVNDTSSKAAMCHVFVAWMISVTLRRKGILSESSLSFTTITPNVPSNDIDFKEEALSDESKHTREKFIYHLQMASQYFFKAGRYELIPELSKSILPLFEHEGNYQQLLNTYDHIKKAYEKSSRRWVNVFWAPITGSRFSGMVLTRTTEPELTSLPVIVERLKKIHRNSARSLKIIQESSKLKWRNLDQNSDYIQVNAVKPRFPECKETESQFIMHHNIGTFELETPFCLSGKTHGSVDEQCIRITLFKTAQAFPYVKKRILIIEKEVIVLSPIQVSDGVILGGNRTDRVQSERYE
ncbi:Dedicator of cytokinesis protein 10 [Thelohanellus kitauei]|uniref:Dedicator of cytokinesis protein 10 n=1 Tax=Thelohanellus kitauei TaxID=669202 RepID=A0A0C2J517_THEKT|nr:Dedicator of cytokinesis protein 10 [Thelohanellus kitauei]